MNSASSIAADVRAGGSKPAAIFEATLSSIGDDPLNAYTSLTDVQPEGLSAGSLAGVPIGLKDLIDHVGHPTTCGSGFLSATPVESATVVRRLEAAGAIIAGRTGLHEFAFGFSSENHWFGPVKNPWDSATSPGGSSGGSAATVAAGHVPIAIGTDTGGSVRVPAALCGIYGLKVTHGRIPLTGVFPLAPSIDTVGPLARSIEDIRLCYEVLRGYDGADPWSQWPPTDLPVPRTRLRIGIPTRWIDTSPVDATVRSAFDHAVGKIGDLGHEVVDVDDPTIPPASDITPAAYAEIAAVHKEWFDAGQPYGPRVAERMEQAMSVTMKQYAEARAWRSRVNTAARSLFDGVDLLLTPTVGAMRKVIGEDEIVIGDTRHHYRSVLSCFTALVNHLRAPALAMPLNIDGAPPPSIQAIGPRWSENRLLDFGRQLEESRIVGFRPPSE